MDHKGREKALAEQLRAKRYGGMLITHLPNIRYLCGFTGSSGALAAALDRRGKVKFAFFTDGRYTDQAKAQVEGARVVIDKTSAVKAACEWMQGASQRGSSVAFESEHMSVASHALVRKQTAGKFRLRPVQGLVEGLRKIKEPHEIDQIRAAVLLASEVFDAIVHDIKPGKPEASIAAELEYLCRRMGAEGMSFDTLVAAGKRSALPHGVASQNPIPERGFVILDFGVILGGYCSDMTRTVHMGAPDKQAQHIYQAVLAAQLAGIKRVKPGVETHEVDFAARKVLEKAGLAKYFTHSTGHGVGLEIHEPPGLRKLVVPAKPKGRSPAERLEAGMVITIEPGVYLPGYGGVRIEDMVVVTDEGCEVLTPTGKDLIVL